MCNLKTQLNVNCLSNILILITLEEIHDIQKSGMSLFDNHFKSLQNNYFSIPLINMFLLKHLVFHKVSILLI